MQNTNTSNTKPKTEREIYDAAHDFLDWLESQKLLVCSEQRHACTGCGNSIGPIMKSKHQLAQEFAARMKR